MKAEYTDVWYVQGKEITGSPKSVNLPFNRISARAIIIRRRDGFILGTLHQKDGMYALPGGALEDGESTDQAVRRELSEENIYLINPKWDSRVVVDYFDGYRELNVWHMVVVYDADVGHSTENVVTKWMDQGEDVWYPYMREQIIIALNRYHPDLSKITIDLRAV